MRGLRFLGNEKTEIREFPKPEANGPYVVVKIKASALCGTDFPFYKASTDILGGIPGHELSGVVVEVDRPYFIKVGDRVVINTQVSCGSCDYCRGGKVLHCESMKTMGVTPGYDGGHSDYVLVHEKDCLKLPENIDFTVGSVIPDGVGVAFTILNKMNIKSKETLAIFGCGPIGLGIILLSKFWNCTVIGVDIVKYRLDLSKKLGADFVINSSKENPINKIKAITNGIGVNKAIDCAGGTDITTNQALDSVQKEGIIGFVGQKGKTLIRNLTEQIILKEITIYSSCGYNISDYGKLISFVQGGLAVEKMITHKFPFEKADEAYKKFCSGETGKVVLVRD